MKEPESEDPDVSLLPRGLRLPAGNRGVASSEQQQIHASWNTLDAVEQELATKGLTPMERPSFEYPGSVTPAQLTTSNNQDYSTLYAQHLGWYNFVAVTLARVKARLLQIANEMDDIGVCIRKDMADQNRRLPKEERFTTKAIDDATARDPRYKELTLEKQAYDQMKLEYDAYLDSMDRNLKVVSRQVEIRRLEHEGAKTEGALPMRGYVPGVRSPQR